MDRTEEGEGEDAGAEGGLEGGGDGGLVPDDAGGCACRCAKRGCVRVLSPRVSPCDAVLAREGSVLEASEP